MISKFQLPNKLSVILVESKKSPVVTVQMWVRTGSADERPGEEGISHFIEHLLFKGTEAFGVGEIANIVEGDGGELNAYTSFDQTVFHVTLSRQHINTGLKVIREMMGSPRFDREEIDREREVVCEEIKRSLDSPAREAARLMFETAYQEHPYGTPVIGFPRTVRKVSRTTIVNYYQSRYVPSNMTLLIAGDFDRKDLRLRVSKLFSDMPKFPLRKVKRAIEPKQVKARVSVKHSKFQEDYVNISWKGPKPAFEDIAALEVLALILGQGESSRLVQSARIKEHIANSIGSGLYALKDGSLFIISASLKEVNLEKTLEIISNEIIQIIESGPGVDELNKAIINFEAEEFFSLETVDGLARKVGHYNDLLSDPLYFKIFMEQLQSVTAPKIVAVAKKYLKPDKIGISYFGQRDVRASKKLLSSFVRQYGNSFVKIKSKPIVQKMSFQKTRWKAQIGKVGKTQKMQLGHGAEFLFRLSKDTPTVSLKLASPGGLRTEAIGKQGSMELFSSLWTAGTATWSESEIQKKLESMAASLHGFAGRNSQGLSLEILSSYQEEAARLLKEIIMKPTFPVGVLEREKSALLEQLRVRADNAGHVCVQKFQESIFRGHPYSKDMLGKTEDIQKIEASDLTSVWMNSFHGSPLKVSVVGDADIKLWQELFEGIAAGFAGTPRNIPIMNLAPLKRSELIFNKMEKEQTHIVVGYRGLTFTDEDRFALQVMQSVLAGQGGRLFVELRDKNSLAYTVSPLKMEGIDTGYFGAYIACSPEKSLKSLALLKEQFQIIASEKVSSKELDRSINYLIGRHDIDLQRNSAVASSILFDEMYGLDFKEIYEFPNKIRNVTSSDVLRVAQRILNQNEVISIAGQTNPMEEKVSRSEMVPA